MVDVDNTLTDHSRGSDATSTPLSTPSSSSSVSSWVTRRGRSAAWLLVALVIGAVAQIAGLAGAPRISATEGVLTTKAWDFVRFGDLTSTSLWGGDPAAGVLQLAGYTALTGSFGRHELAVVGAREFMVLVTMVSAVLLWVLARRLGLGRASSAAAVLLFTVAPIALQVHRSVSVEQIGVLWLLAAFVLAVGGRRGDAAADVVAAAPADGGRGGSGFGFAGVRPDAFVEAQGSARPSKRARWGLLAAIAAGITAGIAVVTAPVCIVGVPLVAWLVARRLGAPGRGAALTGEGAASAGRRGALVLVAGAFVAVVGVYFVVASALGWGVGVLQVEQVGVGVAGEGFGGGTAAGSGGGLVAASGLWWVLDPVGLVVAGGAAVGGLLARRLRPLAVTVLVTVAVAGVLAAAGVLIVLVLPLVAVLVPGIVQSVLARARVRTGPTAVEAVGAHYAPATPGTVFARQALGLLVVTGVLAAAVVATPLWNDRLTAFVASDVNRPLRDAESWLGVNLAPNTRVIVDDALVVDLFERGFARAAVSGYAALAPSADATGWRDVDYLVATASLGAGGGDPVAQAIEHSTVVASFGEGAGRVDVRKIDAAAAGAPPAGQADAEQAGPTPNDAVSAADRAAAGVQLAANPDLTLSDGARELLTTGRVDSRVILSLAQLLGDTSVVVADFPLATGENTAPRRQLLIESSGGVPAGDDPGISAWFSALGEPVRPASVTPSPDGLVVTFPVGEPEGLIPPAAP
ncbi:hypothetical protein [Herbiconiux daphne]|uniref:Glycosyltransferase RgtA/B/C/D-like domain-containing protein n=1 Tax=Herbiconiux daphne TaxID=2970914 RepID=A0ABT2GVZ5_9MICO|nr:hypothetical protein [Herbiconiux daphne]MCS5732137.1 hypothetical protein [Herbiconiux daphne]